MILSRKFLILSIYVPGGTQFAKVVIFQQFSNFLKKPIFPYFFCKIFTPGARGLKINSSAIVFAAKRNDYERVKVLFRYGYRLQRCDTMTDPLKKIELFKALASPAYIVASLENSNEVSSDFFCPVKMCFEFACEANFRKSTIPEYKREYAEIESR